jgi:hypothetical protein
VDDPVAALDVLVIFPPPLVLVDPLPREEVEERDAPPVVEAVGERLDGLEQLPTSWGFLRAAA